MKAIIYSRQSKDRDGDGTAVERQLESCRLLAQARDLEVIDEIIENDTSASKGNRPGFAQILRRLAAGEASAVVVWHTDRLYRRVGDLVKLMEIAESRDVWIMTVRGGDLDLTTASGRMFANMTAGVARYEVEHKSERQIAANRQRAAGGHWQFSRRPYGYQRAADGSVEIVESEAAVVREAYRRYLDGESYYAIASSLNSRGTLTGEGAPWTLSTLRARLQNPAYAGILVYRSKVIGEGNWEPIINRETWNEYLRMRTKRGSKHSWSNQGKHLLSGLLICGVCGSRLFARPEHRLRKGEKVITYSYACRPNWCVNRNLVRLDNLIEQIVIARFSRPDVLELVKVDESTSDLESEAREVQARWDSLAALVASGDLRPEAVKEQTQPLKARLQQIETALATARDRSVATDLALAEDVEERWRALSLPKKRHLISSLMEITINKQANPRQFDPEDVAVDWLS